MEPSAERLTRIDHHHRVTWLGGMFTPWRSNHDPAEAKDRELGAPGGRPLLCRNAPNRKFANPAQAEAASCDRGESFKFVAQCRRRRLIRGGIWKPCADAHRGERIMWRRQRIVGDYRWDRGFCTGASGGEARQTLADRLC
jgi:hypothetical protein